MSDNPYAPERDYWDSLDPEALEWMKRFVRATTYGNQPTLRELCDAAGSNEFDTIRKEVSYERDYYKRATFVLTRSRYCAEDYGWSVLSQEKVSETSFDDSDDFTAPPKQRKRRKFK